MDEKEKKGKKPKKEKKKKKKKGEGEGEVSEKGGGPKKLILIIIAAIVLLGGAAAAYFFVFKDMEKPVVYSFYVTGDPYYANLKNSDNLLRASVVLILNTDDEELQATMTVKNALIRDTIIFLLRDMEVSDVKEGTQEKLRKNIIEQLNLVLEIDNIVGVAFNDFVMQ